MNKVAAKIVDRLVGTPDCITTTVEDMIVEGVFSQEYYDLYWEEILGDVDSEIFECDCCAWICYQWESSEVELHTCKDCAGENQ